MLKNGEFVRIMEKLLSLENSFPPRRGKEICWEICWDFWKRFGAIPGVGRCASFGARCSEDGLARDAPATCASDFSPAANKNARTWVRAFCAMKTKRW